MSVDSYRCTQCAWFTDGTGADDRADGHWRQTHHAIDTVPPAETDWFEGIRVIPLREDDGDPDLRAAGREFRAGADWRDPEECLPDGRYA